MNKVILSFILMLLTSCFKEYNQKECQNLSFRSYKGSPQAEIEFQEHCENIDIKITKKDCQKGLVKLVLTGSLEQTQNIYGKEIKNCFTENDFKNFILPTEEVDSNMMESPKKNNQLKKSKKKTKS